MLVSKKKIHLNNDFDKIFKTGRSIYGRFLGVKSLNNNKNISRFAVILGVKVEKRAVYRHLLKRKIFNIIAKIENKLPFSKDYVIIALPTIKEASNLELEKELASLLGIKNDDK